ncbi:GntR family transcriptional regulator [Caproiciproducens sp. CPB-2]|uniref:GntR family transcriptional regulator n=1 Tax=Caproiciproducens sp. CPB-2 TaxID=3030017 RepID=UPI0023DCAA6D|nr:GntR family transcriptional regulator [Caproiciproducens sp. CPB-2]MDF1493172.1 GntR family transcriptional regulator [Caproiciproducens sp. CPB-2]
MPKYKSLAKDIHEKIKNGTYSIKLPTINDFVCEYQAGRNTVRSALDILVQQGEIHKVQGSGYYINKNVNSEKKTLNISLKRGLTGSFPGQQIKSKVLELSILSSDEKLSARFNCSVGTPLYFVRRLRFIDDIPIGIENAYYNKRFVIYLNEEIASRSIFYFIRDELMLKIGFSDEFVSAKCLDKNECALLNLDEGQPGLIINEINYLKSGDIFNVSNTIYNYQELDLYFSIQNLN